MEFSREFGTSQKNYRYGLLTVPAVNYYVIVIGLRSFTRLATMGN